MTGPHDPVIVAARRTPIGTAGHAFKTVTVDALAAAVIGAVARDARRGPLPEHDRDHLPDQDRANAHDLTCGGHGRDPDLAEHAEPRPSARDLTPSGVLAERDPGAVGPARHGAFAWVEDVVLGNCMGPGGNVARVAALRAGLGEGVPGVTVDRQCGSGLAAILIAAQAVRSGDMEFVIAGGAESASTAPVRAFRDGSPYERAPFAPEGHPDPDMGEAAEALGAARGVSRERQDSYAAASHAKAVDARAAGRFAAEIVPVGEHSSDQRPRTLRPATLARLPGAFVPGGAVTAGNCSPNSDGAAAVAVVPERLRDGRPGLRLVAGAVVGCDPALPGWGPVPAVRRLLARTGTSLERVAAVEIVEAFAAQTLAVTDALGLDPLGADAGRVCADGGAIALGHPWGASGAVVVTRLFTRLVRAGAPRGTLGLATAAVGGGLGVAALFEVV
ncbi:thiolase family protein [Nonomuraea sp. NPDC050478]|uniref:thiolase family protein n=1 Tax=Nonomuraea sp. NPDC050478 TaxID=3364365 RepID=UPI0037A4766F